MTSVKAPICMNCRHFDREAATLSCTAFAEIPTAILANVADHREPYAGDNGIQFEQDPDQLPLWHESYDVIFGKVPAA